MRWDELFHELDREWEAATEADLQVEVAERTRAELARIGFLDRLRGGIGSRLRLHTPVGLVTGELTRVAADCVLLRDGTGELLLTVQHLGGVEGLPRAAVTGEQAGAVATRLGLGSVLRRVARDRAAVTVQRAGSAEVHGTPLVAGADFVELAVHDPGEPPRTGAVRSRQVLPFGAVVVVRPSS